MKRETKGMQYEKRSDGGCSLRSAVGRKETDVVVPSFVMWKGRVVAIDDRAFFHQSDLTSVGIPESVRTIGAHAFDGCSHLATVVLPQGLRRIGKNAFWGCDALTALTVGDRLESIHASAFRENGYARDPSRWKDGFLYLGRWIVGAQAQTDVYHIPAEVVGLAADVFVPTHVRREQNPQYEAIREQFYLALEVPNMPLPELLEVPQYFEEILPVRIRYEGTLAEWACVRKPRGDFRIPAEIVATDGTVSEEL